MRETPGMQIYPHPMMDETRWSVCPLSLFGGSQMSTVERDELRGGPSSEPWVSRVFRALRVAANGGALESVLGSMSAAAVDAVCVVTAERDTIQREDLERAQRQGAR